MSQNPASRSAVLRRRLEWVAVGLAGGAMWWVGAGQFTSGVLDLVIFASPAAALGLAATWAGHAFVPERFTWHRGLAGAARGAILGIGWIIRQRKPRGAVNIDAKEVPPVGQTPDMRDGLPPTPARERIA
jgi:hypothetical protein